MVLRERQQKIKCSLYLSSKMKRQFQALCKRRKVSMNNYLEHLIQAELNCENKD